MEEDTARREDRPLPGFHVDPFPDERGGKALWDAARALLALLVAGRRPADHASTFVGAAHTKTCRDLHEPEDGREGELIAIAPISICGGGLDD